MKRLIFLSLCIFSLRAFSGISIVSDFDDTLKITNSGSEIDGGINAFFTDDYFTGMPELLHASRSFVREIHILSASPLILRSRILKSLNKRGLEVESLLLKNSLQNESKFDYKVRELRRLLENSSDDFVLIGDDVGQDPEAYAEIKRLFPNRILATYIHVIKNRKFQGTPYWSTFDLALWEYISGRLADEAVMNAAELILSESKFSMIIPDFGHCPQGSLIWAWQVGTLYSEAGRKIAEKITVKCQARSSGIFLP